MSRDRPEPFLAPRPSRFVQRLGGAAAPSLLRFVWNVHAVEIAPADRERLRALRGRGALVLGNHPTLAEPAVFFHVLRREGVSCLLLTAWDTLTAAGPHAAAVMQGMGAYSVRRGRRDRASMEATERLLVDGERVLLFPEGQTYGLNDTLLPFQQGALLIGFRAAETMAGQGIDAPLLAAPVAVKYLCIHPARPKVEASLRRLEAALELPQCVEPPYPRLRRVAGALVARLEREQGLAASEAELGARIDRLRTATAERLAAALDARLPPGAELPGVVQLLANAYEDFAAKQGAEPPASVRELHRLWLRLKTFVAVRDNYVSEWPSAERYLDILGRLELDVLGRSRIRAPRRAVVRVGEAIDLREHLPAYRAHRRETLAELTEQVEGQVRGMLAELGKRTERLKV